MATRLELRTLDVAEALLRGFGFLAVVVVAYVALHRAGVWDPLSVAGYGLVALSCAVSLALWRRIPVLHLLAVCGLVGDPWWLFGAGEIRAIPLVLAAFLAAYAGVRALIALPVVVVATLSAEFPGWPHMLVRPELWGEYVLQNGLSLPILVSALGVAAVLVGRSAFQQRHAAESLRTQNAELARLRESDRERIANEERTAIAREVHDVVAHHLAAIVVRAQAAERAADRNPGELRSAIRWIAQAGPQALTEMRGLVRVLRKTGDASEPPPVALADAIEAVADHMRSTGVEVRVTLDLPDGLNAMQEFALLRVCQEALTNVLVHSSATAVEVTLAAEGGDTVLIVEDNGARGRSPEDPVVSGQTQGGSGIPGMHERARAVGGTVTTGWSSQGWRVRLALPTAPALP